MKLSNFSNLTASVLARYGYKLVSNNPAATLAALEADLMKVSLGELSEMEFEALWREPRHGGVA